MVQRNHLHTMQFLSVVLLVCEIVGVVSGAPSGREVGELKNNELLERDTRQAGACGCSLTVYDHPNFGGRSLLVLQQNANFSNDFFNDRVESAIIAGSCSWVLYEDANFHRHLAHVKSGYFLQPGSYYSSARWGGPANQISSARALPPPGTRAIALFEHGEFEGRMLVLYGSISDLHATANFNNHVSSAIVFGGTWRLYEDRYYQGRYKDLTTGDYQYGQSFTNDQLSSIELF